LVEKTGVPGENHCAVFQLKNKRNYMTLFTYIFFWLTNIKTKKQAFIIFISEVKIQLYWNDR
jgi:hypothetical protein